MRVSKRLTLLAGVATIAGMTAIGAAKAAELTVYTAIEADDLKRYAKVFNESYPDIKIN